MFEEIYSKMYVLLTLKCGPRGSSCYFIEESCTVLNWQNKKSTFIVLEVDLRVQHALNGDVEQFNQVMC